MKGVEAYPLNWPIICPRAKVREFSRFKTSFGRARDELLNEISLMGGSGTILSTNIPIRNDGLPYAKFATPKDPGVAVYFSHKSNPMCFACDRWIKIEDNIQSIRLTIGALRGIERWGASDMLEKAFSGFRALPDLSKNWWDVLGVPKTADPQTVKTSRNTLMKRYHPDVGTNPNPQMAYDINKAFDTWESTQ